MKKLVLLTLFFSLGVGFAKDPRITVTVDGIHYGCSSDFPGQNPSADPNCVKNLSDFCFDFTNLSSNNCFDLAQENCRGAQDTYTSCVKETSLYCHKKTSMSPTDCYRKALGSCGGNFSAVRAMIEAATSAQRH